MTYFIDFSIMKKSEKKRPHLDRVKQEKKSGLSIFFADLLSICISPRIISNAKLKKHILSGYK